MHGGKTYALELKAPGGRVTPIQLAAHDELRPAGAEVAIAVGIDEALEVLERWGCFGQPPAEPYQPN
jgi:hypothetical protein